MPASNASRRRKSAVRPCKKSARSGFVRASSEHLGDRVGGAVPFLGLGTEPPLPWQEVGATAVDYLSYLGERRLVKANVPAAVSESLSRSHERASLGPEVVPLDQIARHRSTGSKNRHHALKDERYGSYSGTSELIANERIAGEVRRWGARPALRWISLIFAVEHHPSL
jgi:hypothetical protein